MRVYLRHVIVMLLASSAPVFAQQMAPQIESITVTGDRAQLIETAPGTAAFGLAKPLTETPRAVTTVSAATMDRYGVEGVDDLTRVTPSAYTASFYGVEGAVNLRGTLAENYFRGFKRAENRGTYETPLGDAARVEIVRGPPSAIYGAGKVGGQLNFIPKSIANARQDEISGDASITYGSYSKRNMTAQISAPVTLGFAAGGIHAYGELDDSFSFYRGLHPSHQLLQLSGDFAAGDWSLSADYMFYHADGQVQTPGWNRLTQALIDNGTYITGRDTSLKDADGNGRLTLNELGGNPYNFDPGFQPLYQVVPFCGTCTDAAHSLDTGVGTTHLERRTVYIAKGVDFSRTTTHTGYVELARMLGDGDAIRLQLFTDTLSNDRFVSYGFPGSYRSDIYEARARYDFARSWGKLASQSIIGSSYRYSHAVGRESFNSGVIALDRRDISVGAFPNDILDSPFTPDPPGSVGLGWENDVRSTVTDGGLFLVNDTSWDNGLDLTVGGRYDNYNVRSVDLGVMAFEPTDGKGGKGVFTYSVSLSYKTPFGIVPYITNAKSSAVEIGQAGQVATSLLAGRDWLSASFLNEAGVKFDLLDQHLVGSLAWYAQSRTQLLQGGGVTTVIGRKAQGVEAEIRYVASDNVSFTFAGSRQHSTVRGPDHSFAYLPARVAGVSPLAGFGGSYVTFDFSSIRPGDYQDTLVPDWVVSPAITYTADDAGWGASFSGTYVSRTMQTVTTPLVFPESVTLNASGYVRLGLWDASLNVNNLADAKSFTPGADTYANLSALPGMGRTWRITLKRSF